MLLPLDSAIISANPRFNALYQDLCNNRLNADGTSKLETKAQKERDALSQDLRKARVEGARRDLINFGLQKLSYRPGELPEDLQELVAVVAALLHGQISDSDRDLLQDDLTKFRENVKQINTALSKRFIQEAEALAAMVEPDDPPPSASLADAIQMLKEDVTGSRSTLAKHRFSLVQEASALHDLYRNVIETCIQLLERTIHGSVARGMKAKADYLAYVAEGMSKKLSLQHAQLVSQFYSSELQEALQAKLGDIQSEHRVVRQNIREAEEKLEQYRRTGGMERVAQEYAEILKETAKVRDDIARLETANS